MNSRRSIITLFIILGAIILMSTGTPSISSAQHQAYVFAIREYRQDLENKLLILTLQGIVNQDSPNLLIDGQGMSDWGPADKHWQEVYGRTKNIRFEEVSSIDDLVRAFRDRLQGVVVYDPSLDASRYVAVTMAGLNSWLPVSPDQIKGEIADLTIMEDLRGRWDTQTEAYEWAIENLLPKCSSVIAHNAGQSHDDVMMGTDLAVILALDYSVSRKAFVFNLSPCKTPDAYGHEKIPVPAYPEDARLMDLILERLQAPAKVYGWAEPEWTFTSTLTRHGHYLMCGTAGNLSFHAAVPAEKRSFKQPRNAIAPKSDPGDKHYIAFMTNEGDTPRVISTFFFGAWANPDRGTIPISWGINPMLLHDFPALAEYYYSTATENDFFYAGVSGAGYVFVDRLPSVAEYARRGKPYFDQFDIHVIDAWDEHEYIEDNYETYAREAGAKLFTLLPRGGTRIEILPSGVPVIIPDERVHYKIGNLEADTANILAIAEEFDAPMLIPCYGGLRAHAPTLYRQILEALPADKFEAVTLDDMASLAVEIARLKQSKH